MNCPSCGSEEFVSTPNQYEVLSFENAKFVVIDHRFTDEETVTCRECGEEIDTDESERQRKIILRNPTP